MLQQSIALHTEWTEGHLSAKMWNWNLKENFGKSEYKNLIDFVAQLMACYYTHIHTYIHMCWDKYWEIATRLSRISCIPGTLDGMEVLSWLPKSMNNPRVVTVEARRHCCC